MIPKGVLYQLTGSRSAVHTAVSIWSLRQVYKGPVTVLATEECWPIASLLASDARLDVHLRETELIRGCTKPHFVAKAWTYLLSPFKRTIYLDADTVVQKPIDSLFDTNFGVCRVSDVRINDDTRLARTAKRKVQRFTELGPGFNKLFTRMVHQNPFVLNCGTMAFRREHPALWDMHHMTVAGRRQAASDETALQLMTTYRADITIMDDQWNRCIGYASELSDAAVIHFHAQRWYRHRKPRRLWHAWLASALERNVGGLKNWVGRFNPDVAELVEYGPDGAPEKDA